MQIRMKKEDRRESLLAAAVKVANRVGYKAVTREAVAIEAGVSIGLVSLSLGNMDTIREAILNQGCFTGNLRLIVEGVLNKEPVARKAAKLHKDEIIALLFK